MRIIADQKLFPERTDRGRALLRETGNQFNAEVVYGDFPQSIGTQHEIVAVAGLGIAVASFVVAVLQLMRTPKESRTPQALLSHAEAVIIREGASIKNIEYDVNDITNLLILNGEPAVFVITMKAGASAVIYVGATEREVYASSVETNWWSLLSG